MAEYLGTKLGKWFFGKGIILQDQIDDIRYGFEIACSEILEIIVIVIFGTTSGNILETIVYLILFHTLRECYQGYHAKTITKCVILTISVYLSTMLVFPYIRFLTGCGLLVVSFGIQYIFYKYSKDKKALLITLCMFLVGCLLYRIGIVFYMQLFVVTNLVVSVSWLLGKEKK